MLREVVAAAALRAPPAAPRIRVRATCCSTASRCCSPRDAAAAAPALRAGARAGARAHEAPTTDDHWRWLWLARRRQRHHVAQELWDDEAWHALSARHEQFARDAGALVQLPFALNMVAWVRAARRRARRESALALEEERMIAEATGNRPIAFTEMRRSRPGAARRPRPPS